MHLDRKLLGFETEKLPVVHVMALLGARLDILRMANFCKRHEVPLPFDLEPVDIALCEAKSQKEVQAILAEIYVPFLPLVFQHCPDLFEETPCEAAN